MVQISPPIQKALQQSLTMGDFGALLWTNFAYSFSVISIPPGLLLPEEREL
jgi:hypothetical protein